MRFLTVSALLLAALSAGTSSAETAKITCVCGHTYRFGGDIGDRFIAKGNVTFTADADDEWGYRAKAKSLCRKKFKSLEIEVGSCGYAD